MTVMIRWGAVLALLAAGAGSAGAAETYVRATVEGVIAPGVYGRIDIGQNAPPPVINTAPVVVVRPAQPALRQPLYVYAPPGHIKHWNKHCHRYNACNRPVYFVNVDERGHYVRGDDHRGGEGRRDEMRGGPDRGGPDFRRGEHDGHPGRGGPDEGRGNGHGDRGHGNGGR